MEALDELECNLRNSSKPGRHNLMELGLSQMSDKRLDQHSRFALPNERRCRSNDCFGTRNAHRPKEEDGKFLDEPLEGTPIVQELHEGDEKDDGRCCKLAIDGAMHSFPP